jgi:hypothetical protein
LNIASRLFTFAFLDEGRNGNCWHNVDEKLNDFKSYNSPPLAARQADLSNRFY